MKSGQRYLCGDIGGTNSRLACFEVVSGESRLVCEHTYPSQEAKGLDDVLEQFLQEYDVEPDAACLALAGPVQQRRCRTTNLPWLVDADELQDRLDIPRLTLLNDLEAAAWGIDEIGTDQVRELQTGQQGMQGNRAVIAPGTGLGEAICVFDGQAYLPFATEGGHCNFAPSNRLEYDLLQFLQHDFGHVSWERLVSGPGLENIHRFLQSREGSRRQRNASEIASDAGQDEVCREAMELFFDLLAVEMGNLALKAMAHGGIYIAGGIAPRNQFWLERPEFINRFLVKGRMSQLLEQMPVRLVLEPRLALLGPLAWLRRHESR